MEALLLGHMSLAIRTRLSVEFPLRWDNDLFE